MASPDPAAQQPDLAKESSTSSAPSAAGQEDAPQEPAPEPAAPGAEEVKEGEEEEEGECGFSLFMKGGGCKDAFVAWMDCVDASDKEGGNMVERCAETTINLRNCMDAHADYYKPVLEAEKAVSAQAEAAAEAEKDKGAELPAASTPSSGEEKKEENASSPPAAREAK